jgi:AcrR family transcriptional regulator
VPQVKKQNVENAILESSRDLFARRGFVATTMAEVAREANTTVANLYSYFPSKLHILYAVYRPWIIEQLHALAASVRRLPTPRAKLRRIFIGVWGDIPAADHCFANALIEALAVAPASTEKPNDLLEQCEAFFEELLAESLPEERRHVAQKRLLAHVAWMAFDGFAINRRIGDLRDLDAIADLFAEMLLGDTIAVDGPVQREGIVTTVPAQRRARRVALLRGAEK